MKPIHMHRILQKTGQGLKKAWSQFTKLYRGPWYKKTASWLVTCIIAFILLLVLFLSSKQGPQRPALFCSIKFGALLQSPLCILRSFCKKARGRRRISYALCQVSNFI